MGSPTIPPHVRLVMGVITSSLDVTEHLNSRLEAEFGPIDIRSHTIPFDHTSYYSAEMGEALFRMWFSHQPLISPADIALTKLKTNRIEQLLSSAGKRRVNVDPGYLSLSKFILVTTKDAPHRIYLTDGIFAEVTLRYHRHAWIPFQWTYPDYKEEVALAFFHAVRQRYLHQLEEET